MLFAGGTEAGAEGAAGRGRLHLLPDPGATRGPQTQEARRYVSPGSSIANLGGTSMFDSTNRTFPLLNWSSNRVYTMVHASSPVQPSGTSMPCVLQLGVSWLFLGGGGST